MFFLDSYVTPELIAQQVALVEAVERLVDPEQMGTLFKVLHKLFVVYYFLGDAVFEILHFITSMPFLNIL